MDRRSFGFGFSRMISLFVAALAITKAAAASDPSFAPCPAVGIGDPSQPRQVQVTIQNAVVDEDIDSDFWPFIDRADVEGKVTIDGVPFGIPRIDGSDSPSWDSGATFVQTVTTTPIEITIELSDEDGGASGPDDPVDIDPDPADHVLTLSFDLCSMKVSGDVNGPAADFLVSEGENRTRDDWGRLQFRVGIVDGLPATESDVALSGVSLVQVVHDAERIVSGKPTVVMVQIANTFAYQVDTDVGIRITGPGGFYHEQVHPVLGLAPGELRKQYFYTSAPLYFPAPLPGENPTITMLVDVDTVGTWSHNLPPGDCRRYNDAAGELRRKVIETRDLDLTWAKVNIAREAFVLASDADLRTNQELGHDFIRATYPVANVDSDALPGALTPPTELALAFLVPVTGLMGLPPDAVSLLEPFALVHELDAMAVLAYHDRVIGVLPNRFWFESFSHYALAGFWDDVNGVSLTELQPHAVILVPSVQGAGAPAMALPAHELGHTFGISTDPLLKESIFCGLADPISQLACAAGGAFDEYTSDNPARANGNPSTGYWVRNGTEGPLVSPLSDAEQCDSHCFMGDSPGNAHLSWGTQRRWIDRADYDHLMTKLAVRPDPEVIYVSGMIDAAHNVYLGPWYRRAEGVPERADGDPGYYGIVFRDPNGSVLQDVGLPIQFSARGPDVVIPVTFFGLLLPFPAGTTEVEIWNRETQTLLAERAVSPNAPTIALDPLPGTAIPRGRKLELSWSASDADNNPLEYSVLVSRNGEVWSVLAYRLDQPAVSLPTSELAPGSYQLKVVAADGVNVTESPAVSFTVGEPVAGEPVPALGGPARLLLLAPLLITGAVTITRRRRVRARSARPNPLSRTNR